jgi:membrane peptidoglycan carboxypeptidase
VLRIALALAALIAVVVVAGTVVTTVAAAASAAYTVTEYRELNESLPNAGLIAADTFQTTRILDRNGKLLQEIPDPDYGWRTFAPLDRISQDLIDATVAAEDATFWSHPGIEPTAFGRIIAINLGGSGSSGGSTITQQLVRALHSQEISSQDISVSRKWKEMLAAVGLEQQYSKTDIMTMYLNAIFYGNLSYGVEAAAQTYFHKHASDLTLTEASMLAGIPSSRRATTRPSTPTRPRSARSTSSTRWSSWTTSPAPRPTPPTRRCRGSTRGAKAGALCWTTPTSSSTSACTLDEMYPDRDFTKGGLNIYTTIDTGLQERAERLVAEQVAQLEGYGARNGAMTVVAPGSGEILAMVGSASFEDVSIEGMVNITTSAQQPGSAIKPLVYAAAFEQGWTPGTVVLDARSGWKPPARSTWSPASRCPTTSRRTTTAPSTGAVTVRRALANSLNIPAVKAASYIGGARGVVDIARRMGLKHELNQPVDDYGLSIALGSGDVWPLELTNAYATFANNGKYVR